MDLDGPEPIFVLGDRRLPMAEVRAQAQTCPEPFRTQLLDLVTRAEILHAGYRDAFARGWTAVQQADTILWEDELQPR